MGKTVTGIRQVITEVCDEFVVDPAELVGRSREKLIMQARKEAYRRLNEEVGLSTYIIARLFGRDHSSVSRAQRSYGQKEVSDVRLRDF